MKGLTETHMNKMRYAYRQMRAMCVLTYQWYLSIYDRTLGIVLGINLFLPHKYELKISINKVMCIPSIRYKHVNSEENQFHLHEHDENRNIKNYYFLFTPPKALLHQPC